MAVEIWVDASKKLGPVKHNWQFFGYDEPNYTYTQNGKKLLGELAKLSPVPVYMRCHHLLTSGDGVGRLKWGSTNAYTEDEQGNPIYDWTIVDQIFDAYLDAGVKPFVQCGFMPKNLTTGPEPYEHNWPEGSIQTGWSYPPKSYEKWAELIYQWVLHCVGRYGQEEVETWYWEAWNEPDIFFWSGTLEEFIKLYDYTADAIKRALPTAIVGGPQTTGPENEKGETYLRTFLEHCLRGTNHVTGKIGSPLDFLGFHTKGRPEWVDGRIQMGMQRAVKRVNRGFEIIAEFPELKHLPIVLDEADPDGTAAISAKERPECDFKNGEIYPAYNAAVFHKFNQLAQKHGLNLAGIGTWAFQFENQPWFAGFRSLATNGVNKPILNLYRMLALMRGEHVTVSCTCARMAEDVIAEGVRKQADVNAVACIDNGEITVLVWHYHDDAVEADVADVYVSINGVVGKRILCEQFRTDAKWSNAYTIWKEMGAPRNPSKIQLDVLEQAGQLALYDSPQWCWVADGVVRLTLNLPRFGVALMRLSW